MDKGPQFDDFLSLHGMVPREQRAIEQKAKDAEYYHRGFHTAHDAVMAAHNRFMETGDEAHRAEMFKHADIAADHLEGYYGVTGEDLYDDDTETCTSCNQKLLGN